MKVNLRAFSVMLVGLASVSMAAQVRAQAPGQLPAGYAYYNFDTQSMESPMTPDAAPVAGAYGSSECDGACGGGCGGACGVGGGLAGRRGQAFIGGDWLYLRSNFSDTTAFVERDSANSIDTFHDSEFEYESAFRVFGGYRFSDCCAEVLFTYSRFGSESLETSPEASGTRQIVGPFETVAAEPGSTITTFVDVDAEVYDVDFARTLPLGSALGDCQCNWCPAWDIEWFFGARYAEVEWTRDAISTDPNAQNLTSRTRMEFDGAGPRFGVEGRRYIGRNGNFSVFARGAMSLLLGDVNIGSAAATDTPGVTPAQVASFTRIIPVTEIEVGGTVHVNDNLTVSGGYMFSAWHDLGLSDENYALLTPSFYDDANIMGWDGVFVRGELAY